MKLKVATFLRILETLALIILIFGLLLQNLKLAVVLVNYGNLREKHIWKMIVRIVFQIYCNAPFLLAWETMKTTMGLGANVSADHQPSFTLQFVKVYLLLSLNSVEGKFGTVFFYFVNESVK